MDEGYSGGQDTEPSFRKKYFIEAGSPRYSALYSEGKAKNLDHIDSVIAGLAKFSDDWDKIEAELRLLDHDALLAVEERLLSAPQLKGYADWELLHESSLGDNQEDAHQKLRVTQEETIKLKGMLGLAPTKNIADFFSDIRIGIDNIKQDIPKEVARNSGLEKMLSRNNLYKPTLLQALRSAEVPSLSDFTEEELDELELLAGQFRAQLGVYGSAPELVEESFFFEVDHEMCRERLQKLVDKMYEERAGRLNDSLVELINRPSDKIDVLIERILENVDTARILVGEEDEDTKKELKARLERMQHHFFIFSRAGKKVNFNKLKESYHLTGTEREVMLKIETMTKILDSM